jgi:proton-translocating NADH-quinone oxidoreductase chain M
MTHQFPWLTTILLFPLLAALFIPIIPDKDGKQLRWYALGVGLTDFVLMCYVFWKNYDVNQSSFQMVEKYDWIPQFGLSWAVSVDGISLPLVLLAGLVTTLSLFAAWQVNYKPRLFYFLMLVLYSAQIGVFVAQDILLLFIMWEIELVPVYLLVSIWGGQKRQYAAMKFLLYTAAASIFILVAALGMALTGDNMTFDMAELGLKDYPLGLEIFLYAGLLITFGVKLAIFPLHTWLPDAHVEAPTPVSVVLAGILLKVGAYGFIRIAYGFFPDIAYQFTYIVAGAGVISIINGALNALAQEDLKKMIAYSSISHMGFVLLGLASLTLEGVNGAIYQMFGHGLVSAMLFLVAGVIYDRTYNRLIKNFRGLSSAMPYFTLAVAVAFFGALGLPTLPGFMGEFFTILGGFQSEILPDWVSMLAMLGIVLSAAYFLWTLQRMFFGTFWANSNQEGKMQDLDFREIVMLYSLSALSIIIGIFPSLIFDISGVSVKAFLNGF